MLAKEKKAATIHATMHQFRGLLLGLSLLLLTAEGRLRA